MRSTFRAFLAVAVAACSSSRTPAANESARPAEPASAPAPDFNPVQIPAAEADSTPPKDPRERALSEAVVQLLEHEHLLHKRIDDDVSRAAFKTYMDRLDSAKMYLLESDRQQLAKYADKIDDELHSGSLDLAHDGSKIYADRVAVVDKLVQELLAAPFDLTKQEYLEVDPKKVEPAKSEDELRDRWRQHLELEVLERVGGMEQALHPDPKKAADKDKDKLGSDDANTPPVQDIPATPEGREAKARTDMAKSYAARFSRLRALGPLDADAEVINAVASVFDPHTDYLPPAEKANFDINMTGSLEGIGAVLREKDHYIEVSELVPGGATWRQGHIAPGDLILSVQQSDAKDAVDTVDMRIDDVVKMIRGPKGTIVRLRIQKPTGSQETVSITRDKIVIEEAYARGAVIQRKGQPSYGYIHLPSFYGGRGSSRNSATDVHNLLVELKAKKVDGIIIDIRSNGGGLLDAAVEMGGELIDKGPIVQVKDNDGEKHVLPDPRDDKGGEDYDGPVIVMVDQFSASASEILAGAMQDYHRAIIVGAGPQTHGKGTVQTIADLDRMTNGKIELGVFKITIQQFYRVNGASTQLDGVVPDIQLPDPAGFVESGERTLDHALPATRISAANHDEWQVKYKLDAVEKKSAARVAKQPVLAKIAAASEVLRKRAKDTKIPLEHDAWEKRRKEEKAALEAVSPPQLDKAPANFTVSTLTDNETPLPPGPGSEDRRPAREVGEEPRARSVGRRVRASILGDMK